MSNSNHKLKVKLYENPLTEDPNDCVGRIVNDKSLSLEDVCERVVKSRTEFNYQTLFGVSNLVFNQIAELLADGFNIHTGLFNASARMKGVFVDKNDKYDPQRHAISVKFQPTASLREVLGKAEVEILGLFSNEPNILVVTDMKTGEKNSTLSEGGLVTITGSNLKIADTDSTVGLYLVAVEDGSKTKIGYLGENMPSKISFVVPAGLSGDYRIGLVTQYSHNHQEKVSPVSAISEAVFHIV